LSSIVITPRARRDITSIWRYIAENSIRHADLVEDAIVRTCLSLGQMTEIGHVRPDLTNRKILFVAVQDYDRYTVAYSAATDVVRILRVLHGARDVPRLFR